MKDVLITIKGMHSSDDEKDEVELTTVGSLSEKNGMQYITYHESEEIGLKDVKTVLKVDSDRSVTLTRTGAMRSRLTIEKGQRHFCHYNTGYGEMMVGIFGESIRSTMTGKGGELYMSYTIDVNSELLSRNEIAITVKEAKN
ncbi:MAG: hypothetical protein BGN88_00545 [Clostridiales bacterium 43-6]|nr:MAG: hypothetical protein BGN88_00545 [Clostridiales bacterium 43-6]